MKHANHHNGVFSFLLKQSSGAQYIFVSVLKSMKQFLICSDKLFGLKTYVYLIWKTLFYSIK